MIVQCVSGESGDAFGEGPVGLPYIFAMLTGGAVGVYAAIMACVNAIVVIILLLIRKKRISNYYHWSNGWWYFYIQRLGCQEPVLNL